MSSRVARRALITGGVCAALLVAVYLLAVWTSAGQRFEDAVLGAAELAKGDQDGLRATSLLERTTAYSVAGAVAVVVAIGLVRRIPSLALLATGVIAASVITAEIIQRSAFRPVLLEAGVRREDQSFPSGHNAIAMSVMCALVIVVPYKVRGSVAFLASLWATGIGMATVVSSWHRPSDAIGSDLIVVVYACGAIAILARRGSVRQSAIRSTPGRVARGLLVALYGTVALIALGVGAVIGGAILDDLARTRAGMASEPAFIAGRAIVLAGGIIVTLTLLALLRRADLTAPQPAPPEETGC